MPSRSQGGRSVVRSAFLLAALTCSTGSGAPVELIFDTDIGNDVDDVLALGLIHSLEALCSQPLAGR